MIFVSREDRGCEEAQVTIMKSILYKSVCFQDVSLSPPWKAGLIMFSLYFVHATYGLSLALTVL